jgi:hypothetical protein
VFDHVKRINLTAVLVGRGRDVDCTGTVARAHFLRRRAALAALVLELPPLPGRPAGFTSRPRKSGLGTSKHK